MRDRLSAGIQQNSADERVAGKDNVMESTDCMPPIGRAYGDGLH